MKRLVRNRLFVVLAGLGALVVNHGAAADYHVTAFGDSTAYDALLSRDVETASKLFSGRSYDKMDFTQLNNLCVTRILARELEAAVASCDLALEKVDTDMTVGITAGKSAKASILSNRAVAKAIGGDIAGATSDIEKALLFNASDKNANSNQALISSKPAPAGLAQALQ